MDFGFYGAGYLHPGIECFIAQIRKLLTQYGCKSGIGVHLQASMELLIVEAGISSQPLNEDYGRYGIWVTHCWLKLVWEKIHLFKMDIKIRELTKPPREGDSWIMLEFEKANYSANKLVKLNRVRCHQQVPYMSDVAVAGGTAIEARYLSN